MRAFPSNSNLSLFITGFATKPTRPSFHQFRAFLTVSTLHQKLPLKRCGYNPRLNYHTPTISFQSSRLISHLSALLLEDSPEIPESEELSNLENTSEINSKVLSAVREYRKLYPNCVLLTRVGDFYEFYYEQADTIGGSLLGLQVVDKKYAKQSVRFTGFPARSLERYLQILIGRLNLSVAICEQFKNPHRNTFYRKVNRILTPGTWIVKNQSKIFEFYRPSSTEIHEPSTESRISREFDEFSASHQFLACVYRNPDSTNSEYGLAWVDVSTGDFYTTKTTLEQIRLDMVKIRPREIILNSNDKNLVSTIKDVYPFSSISSLTQKQDPGEEVGVIPGYIGPSITKLGDFYFEDFVDFHSLPSARQNDEIIESMFSDNPTTEENAELGESFKEKMSLFLKSIRDETMAEYNAAKAILNYIFVTQVGKTPLLQKPVRFRQSDYVKMNASTIRALELVKPIEAAYAGAIASDNSASSSVDSSATLIGQLLHTKTPTGSRLLSERTMSPSASIKEIENRLDIVEFFYNNTHTTDEIRKHLSRVKDAERCIQRLSMDSGTAVDMLSIAQTLESVEFILDALIYAFERELLSIGGQLGPSSTLRSFKKIAQKLKTQNNASKKISLKLEILESIFYFANALKPLPKLTKNIRNAFCVPKNTEGQTVSIVNRSYSKKLKNLTKQYEKLIKEREEFKHKLNNKYNVSVKISSTPSFGCFIEANTKDSMILNESLDFNRFQSLRSKSRYYNNALSNLIASIDNLATQIRAEERRIFQELKDEIIISSPIIKKNCEIIAEVDVGSTLADLAKKRGYVRPSFEENKFNVVNGRHPVVEMKLNQRGIPFIANDCTFGENSKVMLLTGPNMGGKSTYLRQVALISIMGQMGSYVPAENAQLTIVDSIYSRIGAHDRLSLNQSTFMVEMAETAEILNNATKNSLVIMDEIGRGTSTEDGMSIAYASLKYLHNQIDCKSLFATHYHEITGLFTKEKYQKLKLIRTAILEDKSGEETFAYIHKIVPGVCRKSFGLYVAEQAGVPDSVIQTAREFSRLYASGIENL